MIKYSTNISPQVVTQVSISTFKGGEVNVNINIGSKDIEYDVQRVCVSASLSKPEHQIALLLATEALRRQFPCALIQLFLPYVPYARQDRICNPGEAHSLKVFGQLINSLNFTQVLVADPHSEVVCGVIDRVCVYSQIDFFADLHNFSEWYIVAPDMGALKKVEKFAKHVGAKGVITCHKERNMLNGEIVRQYVSGATEDELMGKKMFVLDDICDGGRTFVGVAGLLEEFAPQCVELAVTHGIFSYGQEVLTSVYDRVHTTNSWNPSLVSEGKLNVIDVF